MKTRLQELRKQAGFKSARAFAEHYGFNSGTYTNYEQGMTGLTLENAWKFADIFDVTLDELAGRDRPKKEYSDPLQAELNEVYGRLNDCNKSAAVGAVRGIASFQAEKKAAREGPELGERAGG